MQKLFKITFVILGTIIGAGFCSGQEIYIFFNKNGLLGLYGILLSLNIISFIIYKTLNMCIEYKINSYFYFLKFILPEKLKENQKMLFTLNYIINIFLFVSFIVMVSRLFFVFL